MAVKCESLWVHGYDGDKNRTLATTITNFFAAHPEYTFKFMTITEIQNANGNLVAYIIFDDGV